MHTTKNKTNIQKLMDDSWYNIIYGSKDLLLKDSDLLFNIVALFGRNLRAEFKDLGDTYPEMPLEEIINIIKDLGYVRKEELEIPDVTMSFYNNNHYLTIDLYNSNKVKIVCQFQGHIPDYYNINTKINRDIYSGSIDVPMGLNTLINYMNRNGKFLDNWNIDLFDSSIHSLLGIMKNFGVLP